MKIVADAHVHLYPEYDLAAAFVAACVNLAATERVGAQPGEKLLFLTERRDCRIFEKLNNAQLQVDGFKKLAAIPDAPLFFEHQQFGRIGVLPGRQIISKERLELLCYLKDLNLPDRELSAAELIDKIRSAGGVPAINWAPGKWLFERGRLVHQLIDESQPGRFILCDTSLRPQFWPSSDLLRRARAKGFAILYGTDPFPFRGEETRIGVYATDLDLFELSELSVPTLQQALLQPGVASKPVGSRLSLWQVAYRVLRIKLSR